MAANPHACDCVPHARSIRIYAGSNGESHPTAVTTLPSGEELDGEQLRGDHQSLSRLVCDLQIKLCLECGRVSLLNQFDLVRLRAEVDAAEAAIAASRLCARCRGPAVGDVQCDRCGSVCDACRALCSTASHWVTTPYRLQVAARPSSQVGLASVVVGSASGVPQRRRNQPQSAFGTTQPRTALGSQTAQPMNGAAADSHSPCQGKVTDRAAISYCRPPASYRDTHRRSRPTTPYSHPYCRRPGETPQPFTLA